MTTKHHLLYSDHEVRWFVGYCSLSSGFEGSVLSINVTETILRKSLLQDK